MEDIVDRATVVPESMNRDKWAERGAVGLQYQYLLVAVQGRLRVFCSLHHRVVCTTCLHAEGTKRVRVSSRDATLVVWSPDYDAKGKAWVRFDDGTDAIVGGSRVER